MFLLPDLKSVRNPLFKIDRKPKKRIDTHFELVHDGDNLLFQRFVRYFPSPKVNLVAHKYDGYVNAQLPEMRQPKRRYPIKRMRVIN